MRLNDFFQNVGKSFLFAMEQTFEMGNQPQPPGSKTVVTTTTCHRSFTKKFEKRAQAAHNTTTAHKTIGDHVAIKRHNLWQKLLIDGNDQKMEAKLRGMIYDDENAKKIDDLEALFDLDAHLDVMEAWTFCQKNPNFEAE